MYLSEFHNAKETKEVLEKGSPDVFFKWYHKKKNHHHGENAVKKTNEEKMTLTKLAKQMQDGFKQVNNRIDNLEKDINTRIDRVETRIDRIDTRLDYNGLKKLPADSK